MTRAAADGSVKAPRKKLVRATPLEHGGGWKIELECGHDDTVPFDPRHGRSDFPCLPCGVEKLEAPPVPKLTAGEKRRRKAKKLSPHEHLLLVAIARGAEWPTREALGGNGPASLVALIKSKGYVLFDPDLALARSYATDYVPTDLGAAAAVTPTADEWNDSPALAEHCKETPSELPPGT